MLMMLDIADALPLILERSGRRTELQIPIMLAMLFTRRGLWRRSEGYRNRTHSNRNGLNHGVGRGVDDRDGVRGEINRHIGSGSVRRDGYPKRILICTKRNGRRHGVGHGVNDRDGAPPGTGDVGSGSVWRNGYPRSTANRNGRNHSVGRGVDDREDEVLLIGHVGSGSVWRDRYLKST